MGLRSLPLTTALSLSAILLTITGVSAQGVSPGDLQRIGNDILQQQTQQTEEQEQRRREFEEREDVLQDQAAGAELYVPPLGGPCFDIRSIDLEGFDAFKNRHEAAIGFFCPFPVLQKSW